MDKKNITPQPTQPVVRVTQGAKASLLAELSEEVLNGVAAAGCAPDYNTGSCGGCAQIYCACSYDGDDAE